METVQKITSNHAIFSMSLASRSDIGQSNM